MFYRDVTFPLELYKKTGEFSTEIEELIDFAPIVLEENSNSNIEPRPKTPEPSPFQSTGTLNAASWLFNLNDIFITPRTPTGERPIIINNNVVSPAEISEPKKSKSSKPLKKTEKTADSDSDSDSDSTANDESKKDDEKKTEINPLITGVLAVSTLSITMYSTYKYAQRQGEVEFLDNCETLVQTAGDVVSTTKFWMKDRESMNSGYPSLLLEDLQKIELLVDILRRLNKIPEKKSERKVYGLIAFFGTLSFASLFTKGYNAVKYICMGGLLTSILRLAINYGLYSSKKYQLSNAMLSKRAKHLIESLKDDSARRRHIISNWNYDM